MAELVRALARDSELAINPGSNTSGVVGAGTLQFQWFQLMCVRVCHSVCQSLVCPRDKSGLVKARITKFGTDLQNNLVKVPKFKVSGSDRP